MNSYDSGKGKKQPNKQRRMGLIPSVLVSFCLMLLVGRQISFPTADRRGLSSLVVETFYNDGRRGAAKTSQLKGGAAPPTTHDPLLADPDVQKRIKYFVDTAFSFDPVTDKVGAAHRKGVRGSSHRYQSMYGMFLLPYAASKPNMKMLEIGLGCTMGYGPGASVALWKKLFPQAEKWEAEYVGKCVEEAKAKGQLEGIHPLVGDQSNRTVLDEWIRESGGKFDIVIDDGGHHNCQIANSFVELWPEVLPGGYYIIEDMHVGRHAPLQNRPTSGTPEECGGVVMSERVAEWAEQLIYSQMGRKFEWKHELPEDILFVHCQSEACVIGKKTGALNDAHATKEDWEKAMEDSSAI